MRSETKILSGERAGLFELCRAFNRGFRDYKYSANLDEERMRLFLERSGMDARDCAVLFAYEEGEWRGAGVALLSVDGNEAWCGGLAVAPEYRRQGMARRLMEAIQKRARASGAKTLRLEALSENQAARQLYRNLSYQEHRELLVWERSPRQGALPLPQERLQRGDPEEILTRHYGWHDLRPAWQRSLYVIKRSLPLLEGLVINAKDGEPVAYALIRHNNQSGAERVHIVDTAVDPAADLLDAARPLYQALQLRYIDATLSLLNEPADSRLNRIFAALDFNVVERQVELERTL